MRGSNIYRVGAFLQFCSGARACMGRWCGRRGGLSVCGRSTCRFIGRSAPPSPAVSAAPSRYQPPVVSGNCRIQPTSAPGLQHSRYRLAGICGRSGSFNMRPGAHPAPSGGAVPAAVAAATLCPPMGVRPNGKHATINGATNIRRRADVARPQQIDAAPERRPPPHGVFPTSRRPAGRGHCDH